MKKILMACVAIAAALSAGAARADKIYWSVGVHGPVVGTVISNAPPVYVQPQVIYSPPPVVYSPPPRVIYAPPQVVYPAPVVVYEHKHKHKRRKHHHHHHRHYWGGDDDHHSRYRY